MAMKLSRTSLALAALIGVSSTALGADIKRPYIVQLADKPVSTYTGGIKGLPATAAATGRKLNVNAQSVRDYMAYLASKQDAVLGSLGVNEADKLHQYQVVLNGFSALLTDKQARALKLNSAVLDVAPDEPRELDTNYTPAFLGLDAPGGLWQQLGGQGAAGEDIIIGIVDGGIWPENPAFSDKVDGDGHPVSAGEAGEVVYGPAPLRFQGACETGPGFKASDCNHKLIGARFFDTSFRASGVTPHWSDWRSPRDQGGHGSHTASTAGGNAGVAVTIGGVALGRASGMAPRARIAAYKVCWTYVDATQASGSRNSCFTGDNVQAIEQAVLDGVDVINYSISGTQTNFNDSVEKAFLGAARAGVFVAASAGNSGPGNQVAHISPWLTTVGASTHDRFYAADVTVDDGTHYRGASLASALPASPVILSTAAGRDGAPATDVRLCFNTDVLDPAKVAGKVVICDRGTNARVDKSAAVLAAGGVGMVLVNTAAGQTLDSDNHSVPSVHLDNVEGAALKAYVAAASAPTAAISEHVLTPGFVPAPLMADFSSRGPNKANLNVLKPDVTAPGVSIIAAYAPAVTQEEHDLIGSGDLTPGYVFEFLQGTSMSSPHIAGIAALLKQRHPDWSPAAIKSAMMTSATSVLADGQPGMAQGQLPWGQGAGHVNPNGAADPGLVYDIAGDDYYRFLCGQGLTPAAGVSCASVGSLRATDLNLASLTHADVLGKGSMNRTVTNVGNAPATYTASASLPGFDVAVVPASLTLQPGESASFRVDLTRSSAVNSAWNYGELVWSDGQHRVRSPLTARASMLAAASEIGGASLTGSRVFSIGTGFAGTLATTKSGLKPATRQTGTLAKDLTGGNCAANGPGIQLFNLAVPAGASVVRLSLFDEYTSGYAAGATDDLDLNVYNAAGTLVGSSGGSTSNEQVQLLNPAAGTYKVCVIGYAPHGGSADYTLFNWVLKAGETDTSLKVIAPSRVYTGGTASMALSWNVAAADKYLGSIQYRDAGNPGVLLGTTVVSVEADAPLPVATQTSAGKAAEAASR